MTITNDTYHTIKYFRDTLNKKVPQDIFKNVDYLIFALLQLYRSKLVIENHYSNNDWIWGIDPSYANTGLVFLNAKTTDTKIISFGEKKLNHLPDFIRTSLIVDHIAAYYDIYPPRIIVLENFKAFKGRLKNSVILYNLQMLLRKAIYDKGGAILFSPMPKELKVMVTNNIQDTSKESLVPIIKKIFNYSSDDNDKIDALAFAYVGYLYNQLLSYIDLNDQIFSITNAVNIVNNILIDYKFTQINFLFRYLADIETDLFTIAKPLYKHIITRKISNIEYRRKAWQSPI